MTMMTAPEANAFTTAWSKRTPSNPAMIAYGLDGCALRYATQAETVAYLIQPCIHPSFRKAVRVGDVLIDECTGPGVNCGDLPLFWD